MRFGVLFFLILLPTNLLAQAAATQPSPAPTPAAQATPVAKPREFNPLLPFQGARAGGPIPVEISSGATRFEGGVAIAENDVVIRYGDVTIYCDYAEYNPDTHDIVLRGHVRFFR